MPGSSAVRRSPSAKRDKTALLLIDFMNPFDYPGADRLAPRAVRAARNTAGVKSRMRAKRGPIQLARLAGAPLLAVAWSTSNCIVFHKSWDHFILPLPFGHGALIWSDPIAPPAMDASDAEIEAVRLRLEAEMNRIAAEADRITPLAAALREVRAYLAAETGAADDVLDELVPA